MIHSISLHYDHLLYSATFPARLFLIFFCFVFCLPIHRAASFAVYDRPFRAFLHRQAGHSNSIWLACFHGVTRNRRRETADTCIPSTASTVAMTKIKKTIMSRIRRFCICEMGYKFFFCVRSFVWWIEIVRALIKRQKLKPRYSIDQSCEIGGFASPTILASASTVMFLAFCLLGYVFSSTSFPVG